MGEVRNVFSIFGAVDDAVVDQRGRAVAVAALLRPYEDPDTPGWYAALKEWAAANQTEVVVGLELDDALAAMAEDEDPSGWERARRLLAIAALARAYPDTYGEPGNDEGGQMAVGALRALTPDPDSVGESPEDDPASQLLLLMGNKGRYEGTFDDLDDWHRMLAYAAGAHLIDQTTARLTTAPCSGTAIVDSSSGRPVLHLTTHFMLKGATIDQIGRYLDPGEWPHCARLWCTMDSVTPPERPRRHMEVIGLDCAGIAAGDAAAWRLRTCLEFSTRSSPTGDRRSVGYRIAQDRADDDRLVEVDSGSISAHQLDERLSISTTKRLRFKGLDLGPGTAMLMCALGWASVGEHMVYSCALEGAPGSDAEPDTTFEPAGSSSKGTEDTSPLAAMAAVVVGCVNETASTIDNALDEARSGTYTSSSLLRDSTAMWTHSINATAELAMATSRLAMGPCAPCPPSKSPAGHRRTIESASFTLPAGSGDRRLVLAGDLVNDFGDTIVGNTVELRPTDVGPGRPTFRLVVEVADDQAGAYWGEVIVTSAGQQDPNGPRMAVEVVVP